MGRELPVSKDTVYGLRRNQGIGPPPGRDSPHAEPMQAKVRQLGAPPPDQNPFAERPRLLQQNDATL